MTRGELNAMVEYPGPAYLFGIDQIKEVAYVVAVTRKVSAGFSAMPTDHELDCQMLSQLWNEVRSFWSGNTLSFSSRFAL